MKTLHTHKSPQSAQIENFEHWPKQVNIAHQTSLSWLAHGKNDQNIYFQLLASICDLSFAQKRTKIVRACHGNSLSRPIDTIGYQTRCSIGYFGLFFCYLWDKANRLFFCVWFTWDFQCCHFRVSPNSLFPFLLQPRVPWENLTSARGLLLTSCQQKKF